MNPCPKPKTVRSPKHLARLRKLPCCLSGRWPSEYSPTEAHHVKMLGGGGMSKTPPDDHALPLNIDLHRLLDSPGWSEIRVFRTYLHPFGITTAEQIRDWVEKETKRLWRETTEGR